MPRLRPTHRRNRPPMQAKEPQRLPQRWAIIAMVTAAAAIVAYLAGGPIAAITVGAGVLVAAHRVLD
ncbi:hypothetical protein [Micromonospora sp. NPDC048898]|uniref:hypothetical protein n=1 Tax=Micromonospora sp. NPDC048898 TaxID=3364260 RepID=UPI00371F9857